MQRPADIVLSVALWALAASLTPAPRAGAEDERLPEVGARPAWELRDVDDDPRDGYRLYERRSSSGYTAYRLEALLTGAPARVAEAAMHNIRNPRPGRQKIDRTFLRSDADVVVVHNLIDLPWGLSDRDLVTRVELTPEPDAGSYRLRWTTVNALGPEPADGVVRIPRSEGFWHFSPANDGNTIAVYESLVELGGSLPAWLVNSQMSGTATEGLENLRTTLRESPGP